MIQELYVYRIKSEVSYLRYDFNSYAQVGVIGQFKSLIWHEKFYDKGEFELVVPFSDDNLQLLKTGRILTKYSLLQKTRQTFMTIKQVKITSDHEGGEYITVKGTSSNELLERRIVWEITKFVNKNIVEALYTLVAENAGIVYSNPTELHPYWSDVENYSITKAKRSLYLYIFKKDRITVDKNLTIQITGKNLLEIIKQICQENELGFEIGAFYGYHTNFANYNYFKLIKPTDRSSYVIFSDQYDNIYNSTYIKSIEKNKNTALLAAEGTGSVRIRYVFAKDFETTDGFDKYTYAYYDREEEYVDLRDSDKENMTTAEYVASLQATAAEKFGTITEAFETELFTQGVFKFGQDFFLGDYVSIRKFGLNIKAQVIENIESVDENGYRNTPIFAY